MNKGHHNLIASIANRLPEMDRQKVDVDGVLNVQFRFDGIHIVGDTILVHVPHCHCTNKDDGGTEIARYALYNELVKMFG